MQDRSVNRLSLVAVFGLSAIALSTLVVALGAAALSGQPVRREPDEGTGAHIFQLAIAALVPTTAVFIATADWGRPRRVAVALALPACAVAVAFALLHYIEHVVAV
jgi:hypothetical protein